MKALSRRNSSTNSRSCDSMRVRESSVPSRSGLSTLRAYADCLSMMRFESLIYQEACNSALCTEQEDEGRRADFRYAFGAKLAITSYV